MSEYNKESIDTIVDNIISIIKCCLENKDIWNNNKDEMIKIVEKYNKYFHDNYYRITKTIVEIDNIDPLLGMLRKFHSVQSEKIDFESVNKIIQDGINDVYVEPLLQTDKLKKEREIKIANKNC
jgi:hypothetical protein